MTHSSFGIAVTRALADHSLLCVAFLFSFASLLYLHSPLWDPLEFGGTEDNYYGKMTKICRDPQKNENLWEYQKLAEIMQEEQEDWYSIWTTEMIRIAKPGKAIIIEEISLPYCDNMEDWGGVRRDFWKEGTERYGWDIDPESLMVIEGTQKMRYNVLMKKTI